MSAARGMMFRALGLVVVWIVACTARERPLPAGDVTRVLERHTDSLMKIPGVVGTAEGSCAGRPCVLVLVERLTPEVRKEIPAQLDGIQVDVRETGKIRAR